MAKCEICEKEVKFSMQVSHSHRRTSRTLRPNVQSVIWSSREEPFIIIAY